MREQLGFYFYFSRGFAARSRALRARISAASPLVRPARQNRHATQANELGRTSITIFNSFGQVLTHIDKMLTKLIGNLSLISVSSIITFNFRDEGLYSDNS